MSDFRGMNEAWDDLLKMAVDKHGNRQPVEVENLKRMFFTGSLVMADLMANIQEKYGKDYDATKVAIEKLMLEINTFFDGLHDEPQ